MREFHFNMQECDRLPLPRVWEILKQFKTSPPRHLLLRDFVGFKPPSDNSQPFDVEEITAKYGDIPTTKTLPPHLRAHLEEIGKANA